MPANKNWRRWIHASAGEYLSDTAMAESLPWLIEGITDRDEDFMSKPDRVEIRLNGPFTLRYGNCWNARVFINVIVSSAVGEIKDAYKLDEVLGVFHTAMDQPIEIFKRGDGPDDDDSSIGCLHPLGERSTPIRVLDFGEVDPVDHIRQGMVTGTYEIELTN